MKKELIGKGQAALAKEKDKKTTALLVGQRTDEQSNLTQMVVTDRLTTKPTPHQSQTNLIQTTQPRTGRAVRADEQNAHVGIGGNQMVPPTNHQTLQSPTAGTEDPRDLPARLEMTETTSHQGIREPTSREGMTVPGHTPLQPWAGKANPLRTRSRWTTSVILCIDTGK